MNELSREADILDKQDPLRKFREKFHIPLQENGREFLYLCGNSLGLQPRKAAEYVHEELEDWARLGVEGHTDARHPWLPYHEFLTQNMAKVVGAKPSEVVVMNSLTVNLHLLLVSFYRPTRERFKIIIEQNAFPSDIYAVKSQIRFHGYDPEEALVIIPYTEGKHYTDEADLLEFLEVHSKEAACTLIGGVNYYNGQVMPIRTITEVCHKNGCVVGFDMAHGAGNIEMNLHDNGVDFAAWCSYKYLNSGPGSLSGVFIHQRHHGIELPRFEGWWGHDKESRFQMPDTFQAIPTAEAWQLSNPPILPLACMRASLEIFAEAGMENIRKKSIKMMVYAEKCFNNIISDKIEIITPFIEEMRGCQFSIRIPNGDKSIFNTLKDQAVISDWREPDVVRIAFVPLYNSFKEIYIFSNLLKEVINT